MASPSEKTPDIAGLVRKPRAVLFGGLLLFWMCTTFACVQAAGLQTLGMSRIGINLAALVLLLVSAAAALLVLDLIAHKGRSSSKVQIISAAAALVVGSLLLFLAGEGSPLVVPAVGVVLLGAGSAFFFRFWLVSLNPGELLESIVATTASFMLGVLLGSAIVAFAGSLLCLALIAAAVIQMLAALARLRAVLAEGEKTKSASNPPVPQKSLFGAMEEALLGFGNYLVGLFAAVAVSVFAFLLLNGSIGYLISGESMVAVLLLAGVVAFGLSRIPKFRYWTSVTAILIVLLPLVSLAFGLLFIMPGFPWIAVLVLLFGIAVFLLITSYLLLRVLTIYLLDRWEGMVSLIGSLLLLAFAAGTAAALLELDVLRTVDTALDMSACLFVVVFVVTLSGIIPIVRQPRLALAVRYLDDESPGGPGKWLKASIAASEDFSLTKREKEIFLLLAKGRNAEWISNELIISYYTVKTHISNIYKKMGIHRHEELVAIIEGYRENS